MLEALKKIEERIQLSPVQKILLTTDGSITRILEALTGEEVSISTEKQEVIKADEEIATKLQIEVGGEVNFRVVNIRSSGGVLMHAISYTPLKRLKKKFREDIMKADIPIGKIMARLKIEARREIMDMGIIEADERFSQLFSVKKGSFLLKRTYNIIHNNEILLNITEIFPYEAFR
jgi:beta-ribofuranosylaminobenzene 5'-phosphate synthase